MYSEISSEYLALIFLDDTNWQRDKEEERQELIDNGTLFIYNKNLPNALRLDGEFTRQELLDQLAGYFIKAKKKKN